MSSKYSMLIKRIRSEYGEIMGDMADWLGVTLPFVSAVENGKKKIPDGWLTKIVEHYQLSDDEAKELEEAILESQTQIKLNISNVQEPQKRLAIQFQRSFDSLDKETTIKILDILKGDD